jgi:2'-5' RNA ligase
MKFNKEQLFSMNWYKIAKKNECSGWIAVRLPQIPAKKIKKWGRDNIPNSMLSEEEGKGRELDTHITLLYGVCENSKKEVEEILKEYKTIKVKLGEVGFFRKSPDFDVVIVKIISDDLKKLHEKIKRKLDVTESFPVYKPHCCIAYVKKGEGSQFAGDTFVDGTNITFNKVVFINDRNDEFEIKL